jgi:hypothetical protein
MQRLQGNDKKVGDRGYTLYDAFMYAAAMDAIDIEGVDLNVVADLVGIERKNRRTQILVPLGFEAAGTGSGTALRTRHVSIARAAIALAEVEFQTDLEETYRDIVGGTLEAGFEGKLFIQNYGKIINCGNLLSRKLQGLKINQDRTGQIAIAAAEVVEKFEPQVIANTVSLSKTYREANRYPEAKNVLRRSLSRALSCRDWSIRGRGFIYELGIVEGNTNRIHNVCFGGLTLADNELLPGLTMDNAKLALSGIGAACMEIKGLKHDGVYAKCLRAVAVLGSLIKASPINRYSLRYSERANELGVDVCDLDTAYVWLQNAINESYAAIDDDELVAFMNQLEVAKSGSIRFRKLKELLKGLA